MPTAMHVGRELAREWRVGMVLGVRVGTMARARVRMLFGMRSRAFMGDQRVGFEHRLQPLARVSRTVADLGKAFQMVRHVPFVPCHDDRFDIGEVFVERRAADPGLLGDLRHRDRRESVLSDQLGRGLQDRAAYLTAVSLDRVRPEPRHP